ncbi:hypothetical protein K402DRAFT_403859 [Aulographum hederae CBS 113979]|uniref:ARM repeat-containing protein n=1 Tax=Aulographum hederae CBS 113979 TaxID=1176131 RepID=A0A6G1H2B0_9PEZI|nr:hypothetical protein K402DRAFT_403859 [Aulographum hederae CBS 113979]
MTKWEPQLNPILSIQVLRCMGNCSVENPRNKLLCVGFFPKIIQCLLLPSIAEIPELAAVAIKALYIIAHEGDGYELAQVKLANLHYDMILADFLVHKSRLGPYEDAWEFGMCIFPDLVWVKNQQGQIPEIGNRVSLLPTLFRVPTVQWDDLDNQWSALEAVFWYLADSNTQEIVAADPHLFQGVFELFLFSNSLKNKGATAERDEIQLEKIVYKFLDHLAAISAHDSFLGLIPATSSYMSVLETSMRSTEPFLAMGACFIIGNLARNDDTCVSLARDTEVVTEAMAILDKETQINPRFEAGLFTAATGLLRNIAIPMENKQLMLERDISICCVRLINHYDFKVKLPGLMLLSTLLGPDIEGTSWVAADSSEYSDTILNMLIRAAIGLGNAQGPHEVGFLLKVVTLIGRLVRIYNTPTVSTEARKKFLELNSDLREPVISVINQRLGRPQSAHAWEVLGWLSATEEELSASWDQLSTRLDFEVVEQTLKEQRTRGTSEPTKQMMSMLEKVVHGKSIPSSDRLTTVQQYVLQYDYEKDEDKELFHNAETARGTCQRLEDKKRRVESPSMDKLRGASQTSWL